MERKRTIYLHNCGNEQNLHRRYFRAGPTSEPARQYYFTPQARTLLEQGYEVDLASEEVLKQYGGKI